MAIPDFQSIMLPLVQLVADKQVWKLRDTVARLADDYKLTEEERAALLPSGRAPLFYNRVAWAKTHLAKAGVVASVSRGLVQITERGLSLLAENPKEISMKVLQRYPEFTAFQEGASVEAQKPSTEKEEIAHGVSISPEEQLEQAYGDITATLISDVVELLKTTSPQRFEQIVVDVIIAMGYGGSRAEAGRTLGRTGDGGVDGVIDEDKLGLDTVYLQAKRWTNDVGAREIRDFKGALDGNGATKGIFITTAGFTRAALDEVSRSRNYKVVLIDGKRLARYMIEYNVGVSTAATFELKKIDSDYFADE